VTEFHTELRSSSIPEHARAQALSRVYEFILGLDIREKKPQSASSELKEAETQNSKTEESKEEEDLQCQASQSHLRAWPSNR
jgi:hypothetical protein